MLTSGELYGGTEEFSGALGQSDLTAASLPSRGVLPPDVATTPQADNTGNDGATVMITLPDGTLLQGDLYASSGANVTDQISNRPGVLLLANDRVGWGTLPAQLQVAGLTALVVDATPTGTDLTTVLTSLSEAANVDPGRLGVIAAGGSINSILAACTLSELCDAFVLLSPSGVENSTIAELNPRPFFLAAASDDAASYPNALALSSVATEATFRQVIAGQGTGLLSTEGLSDEIVSWITEALER
jgi:hypothetical protein